jgi:hypothetical protein
VGEARTAKLVHNSGGTVVEEEPVKAIAIEETCRYEKLTTAGFASLGCR